MWSYDASKLPKLDAILMGCCLITCFMNLFHMVVPGIGVTLAPCYGHGLSCQPQACDLDVTGTPCQDFAPNGHRLGVHGPQWSVCVAWMSLML